MHIHVPDLFEEAGLLPAGSSDTDIHYHHVGRYVVFDLDGPLALSWAAEELRVEVNRLLDDGRKNLILDLADVPYADSAGVGALVLARTMIHNAGGRLVLVSANRHVVDVLKRTRLEELFTFRTDTAFATQPGQC